MGAAFVIYGAYAIIRVMPDFETILADQSPTQSVAAPGAIPNVRPATPPGNAENFAATDIAAAQNEAIQENAERMGFGAVAGEDVIAHGRTFDVGQALVRCPEIGKLLASVDRTMRKLNISDEERQVALVEAVRDYAQESQTVTLGQPNSNSRENEAESENLGLPSDRPSPNPTTSALVA